MKTSEFIAKLERAAKWTSVADALPPKDQLVLVRGPSGYVGHTEFFIAAYYNAEYRPFSPWLDPTNTALEDSGWVPTHWRPLEGIR